VSVAICPPRRGNRKGVVEKANHVAAQRWWRTLAEDLSVEQAQASFDGGAPCVATPACVPPGTRRRPWRLAAAEPLASLPVPFPATLRVVRTASAQALVSFRGNQYSVPPELARAQVARDGSDLDESSAKAAADAAETADAAADAVANPTEGALSGGRAHEPSTDWRNRQPALR
jgi:hypothetical protein